MLQFDLSRARNAVEEVKQAVEGVKHVMQEVRPGAPLAKFLIPDDATLDQIRAAMAELMTRENVNHHQMGQLYNHVVDKKLAEQEGFDDAATYFSQKLVDLSSSSLRRYGAVAKNFSEEVAVRFGVTCLYLLLTYKEAAGLTVNHEEPGATPIEVPGKDGAVTAKRFSDCSVEQMRQALQLKRKPTSSKPVPAQDVAQVDAYRQALQGQFPQGSHVQVLVRNEKGSSVVDFKSVPVGEVGTLILALMDHVPPGSELRRGQKAPPSA